MLKQLLNRIWKNSDCSYKSNRRLRWPANWNGIAANCAEMLESRQLLTLFVIDTLTDNADDANGISDGLLSLREAITASNSNAAFGDAPAGAADGDSIVFRDDLAGGTLTIGSGEFGISDDLSILTGGASSLTIDAGGLSRIFNIDTTGFNGSNHNVLISGLSLINGESLNNGGAVRIADSAHVSLSQMTISSSHAAESGGGVYAGNGVLNVAGVTLDSNSASGNLASQGGGAIFNNGGTLTIDGTSSLVTISNNTADGTAGSGGGIFSIGGAVTVTSANLTFNAANRAGGGIEVVDGTVSLTNVNLINNDAGSAAPAPGNGGGLHVTGSADVMVSGGSVFGNIASREGGGLWNSTGTMTISNGTLIQGNAASGDAADDGGGGIFNNGGTVIVDGSLAAVVITSNYADGVSGSGGGIFNFGGILNITGTTISDNAASRAGGGIEVSALSTTVIITSTISGNSTESNPGNGGGLHITSDGNVAIDNSTISGNSAFNEGGGLWNSGTGTLAVRNTTITANSANTVSNGGGVRNIGGTTTLTNVIVAGNFSGPADTADDINGPISTDSTANLIGDAATSGGLSDGDNANIVGISGSGTRPIAQIIDPVFRDNGGPTLTHMLVVGSLAIDAGSSLFDAGISSDQRGIARPQNTAFDIGAVEVELATITGRKWLDTNGDGARLPKALVDLGFFAQSGTFFFNAYRGQEKWVRATNADWYFILPNGVITRWDNTPGQLTGMAVAQLPTRFYLDEYLLVESEIEPFLNGWTIELLDKDDQVVATSETADIDLNQDGMIDPEHERGVYQFTLLVSGTYTVREINQTGYSPSAGPTSMSAQQAYDLDQSLNLNYTGNYHTNFGGRGENWLRKSDGWIYILSDGSVYDWDRNSGGTHGPVTGTLIANLDPVFYTNPQLLSDAGNPQVSVAAGTMATGPDFGNYMPSIISGRVFEDTNQDGMRELNEPYRNGRIVQLIDRDGNIVREVQSGNVESDGSVGIDPNTESGVYEFTNLVPGRYTVRHVLNTAEFETVPFNNQYASLAYRLNQRLDLKFTGNYFESDGTNQERFLYSVSLKGWVYITKAGDLYQWNPTSGPAPIPLSGTLIARLDATYYNDPAKLYNAQPTSKTLTSGSEQLDYNFGFYDIDAVFGDFGQLV